MNSKLTTQLIRYSFSTIVFNGKNTAKKIQHSLKQDILEFSKQWDISRKPCLGIIQIGNNPSSISYTQQEQKACDAVGIQHELFHFSSNIQQQDVLYAINQLNDRDDVDGIIAQLPFPVHIQRDNIIKMINPLKDVDCLNLDSNKLNPKSDILPCTPAACLKILEEYNINLQDKHVVIVGRGTVGLPLEFLIKKLQPASITICDKETKNMKQKIMKADVIISAAGQRQLIKGNWVKKGAIVLDVGVNKGIPGVDPFKIVGDVEFEEAKKTAGLITPVPGGIGPITVSMLLQNIVEVWKLRCLGISSPMQSLRQQQGYTNYDMSDNEISQNNYFEFQERKFI